MPDPATLKIGDKIRNVSVPKGDLQALVSGSTDLDETVRVLKWMVGKEFVIWMVDEYGKPWVEVKYLDSEEHTMAIMEAESWVHVRGG
jgi:hypothetical protein